MSDPAPPSWKFYHPLPLWQVIVILLVFSIGFQLLGVALREQMGVAFFTSSIASGCAGGFGVALILTLAKKKRAG